VASTGEALHVCTNLSHDDLGGTTPHTRDRVQTVQYGLTRALALPDLRAQPLDRLVQEVTVGQDLGHQEPLVRAEPSGQSPFECGSLGAHRAAGQVSHDRGMRFSGHQGFEHLATGSTQDVAGDRGQRNVGPFQYLVQPIGRRRPLLDQAGPLPHQLAQLALLALRHEAGREQPRPQ